MKKLLFLLLLAGCSPGVDSPGVDSPDNPQPDPGTTNLGNGQPGVVGLDGIDAWDKLASSEKERIKSWNTLFLHQSVGQDLEEGAKANGVSFEYFGSKDVVDKGAEPPLVYATTADEGNAAKASVGQWMRDTFKNTDVIFDLQAIETNNGACQQNTVPRICPDNRASVTDPSEVNGVDSDGQGHLGKKAAQRISKAFLYAIYQAGK